MRDARGRALRRETAGQSTVEYAGVLAVVAVIAVALTAGGLPGAATRSLQLAVCRLMDADCYAAAGVATTPTGKAQPAGGAAPRVDLDACRLTGCTDSPSGSATTPRATGEAPGTVLHEDLPVGPGKGPVFCKHAGGLGPGLGVCRSPARSG